MKIKHAFIALAMMTLAIAIVPSTVQADNFYAIEDPGNIKPPAKPWILGGPDFVDPAYPKLWFAKINGMHPWALKEYSLDIYTGCPMDLVVDEMRGYYDSPHGGHTESPVAALTKNESLGNRRTITTLFYPSPDWEVIEVSCMQPGGGGSSIEVNQDSHCAVDVTLVEDPSTAPGNYKLTINEGWFGVSDGGGGGGPYIDMIEIYVYQDKWIKPFYQPEYGPPWQHELIEDGNKVVIGVRWIAPKGEFLEAGEKYQMYVTTTSKPSQFVDYYAHDAKSDRDIYINLYTRPKDDPLLGARKATLSASTGGTVDFTLCAGAMHANRAYALLGSVTGTEPGTPLPGGMATLPLNWDPFSNLLWAMINSPVFANFLGTLDGSSNGKAQLNCGPLSPDTVGLKMYYAYTLYSPFSHASNHLEVEVVP